MLGSLEMCPQAWKRQFVGKEEYLTGKANVRHARVELVIIYRPPLTCEKKENRPPIYMGSRWIQKDLRLVETIILHPETIILDPERV